MIPQNQNDLDYKGPPMLSDHDFIVGSYHLLTSMTKQLSGHEGKIAKLEIDFDDIRDTVRFHRRILTWIGVLVIPTLGFLANYFIHH